MSIRKASVTYDISKPTVIRHLQISEVSDAAKTLGWRPVLSTEQEEELVKHIQCTEEALFGLSTDDDWNLVYQYCETNNIDHPFSHDKKQAGWDWCYMGFLNGTRI